MQRVFEHITVVALEQAVAAPLCTRRLALAGANVIKVERPEGDFARGYDHAVAGESAYFVWLNAGKRSVVLDLREAADRGRIRQLLAEADVFVQNLKPGALGKLGLALDDLHAANPRLISMSISGFAEDGPSAQRKAYDLLIQAESGLADITGNASAPGRVGVSIVDIATGHFAYEAILEALWSRQANGVGARLAVSLFDAMAEWLAVPYLLDRYGGATPQRVGLAHPGICPYGVFHSADNRSFILAVQNEREWQRLCQDVLALPALTADARCRDNATRLANREFVDASVAGALVQRGFPDLDAALTEADIAFAPVQGLADLKQHADFHTQQVKVGDAVIELPRVPGHALAHDIAKPEQGGTDIPVVPKLGEHSREVFAKLNGNDD